MSRPEWKSSGSMALAVLAAGVLLALGAADFLPRAPAAAQHLEAALAELLASEEATSAELAVALLTALEGESFAPPACVAGQETFDDVPASNLFCPWIEELARRGITGGCGGGNYCPSAPVRRDQMAVFLVKALEQTEDCSAGLAPNDEMVRVGAVCIDKYEASIWTQRVGGSQITGPLPCAADGHDCQGKIFARSVAGVLPRTNVSWFQAQAALENSGKRLPTNAEWQMAAAGTPDHPGPCNTTTSSLEPTGSRPGCVSEHGTFDMVGNVWEWVADWAPYTTACPGWGSLSDDFMCLAGASTAQDSPGAFIRGGDWNDGTDAGPFALVHSPPSLLGANDGFRGAR